MLSQQIQAFQAGIHRIRARGVDISPDDVILFRTLVSVGRCLGQFAEQALRPVSLAEPEFRVLMALFSQPDGAGHPGELCAGSGQSPANMTRITDNLVALKLITRTPSLQDRRRMLLRVTAQGEALARHFVPAAFKPVHAIFANLSSDAREQLLSSLQMIAEAFDKHCALAAP